MTAKKLTTSDSRGKFIVLYGSNNIGKSTQIRLLAQKLLENKKDVLTIKYPLYSLKPTGPKLNKILRSEVKNPKDVLPEEKLQEIYAQNRADFQPILLNILNSGINVIAEDYKGTGIAWGVTRGVELKKLEKMNKSFIEPDISILLDGDRFKDNAEKVHRNEGADSDKWEKIRQKHLFLPENTWELNREVHLQLAKRYGWVLVKVDGDIEAVSDKVWGVIERVL